MSLEVDEQHEYNQHAEKSYELQKKPRISYSRDFLLSISELDVCKMLPSGFDKSLLSEFEDASQEKFRNSGGLSSQNYRRNEYGSSPPTRGDSSNYSRGIHGRWDSRSSGRSDKDSDTQSQSDWDSDPGRRYGNQSRRPRQAPEHDGLLGSGSFPRPSGYPAGASAPKIRANEQYQLSRTNEPYHPARPYKAMPHSRREANDSYNDETFGSSDCTSEDRAEEERKRRASFELMRKEQQKAFQEKQKLNPERFRDDFDITELIEDTKNDKRPMNKGNELDEPVVQPVPKILSDKSSYPPSAPLSRPLVPPGFSSTVAEKNIGVKPLTHPSEVEIEGEGILLHVKENHVLDGSSKNREEKQSSEHSDLSHQQLGIPSMHVPINPKSEKILSLSSPLDASEKAVGVDSRLEKNSKPSEVFAVSGSSKVIQLDAEEVVDNKLVGESTPVRSTSILEKLLGNALTLNGGGSYSSIENNDMKTNNSSSLHPAESSKFAQWFFEEEKKPVDDLPSGRPNDLLSLIVGGEKGGSLLPDVKVTEQIAPNFPFHHPEVANRHITPKLTPVIANVENTDKSKAVPAVLTCEDLEHSFLSEITVNGSTFLPPVLGRSGTDSETEQTKARIDDHASQHLLSLLQRGTGPKDMEPSINMGITTSDIGQHVEVAKLGAEPCNSREVDGHNVPSSGKPLTLETLFGSAFMKELQPAGALASSQRGSAGSMRVDVSESQGLPFPVADNDLPCSSIEIAGSLPGHGSIASNQRQQMKSDRIEDHFLGLDPRNDLDASQFRTELGAKVGGFDGPSDIRLPEEDSLITATDPVNFQNFMPVRNSARSDNLSTTETTVNFAEKLVALSSPFRDERPPIGGGGEGPPFRHSPYDMREPDPQFRNLHHLQTSSSQLHPTHLNHAGPMFHPLDSHPANISAQMKFMAPESMIHHETPHRQFPSNVVRPPFHHPSSGPTGFDPAPLNPMLQQIHMPGNFPPPHIPRGFPRGGTPMTPHPNSQVPGFVQENNPMQGFPFNQRQPNFGGIGVPLQVPDVGGGTNHPEALQRLIEMELRSSSKQIHPFVSAGHNQGIYGHELDMGFGYR